jgi:hypothetical protein
MTSSPATAENILRHLMAWGIIVNIVGGFIVGFQWPSSSVNPLTGVVEDDGSMGAVIVGLFIAWAGSMMLFVGMVGWGVKLGRDASIGSHTGAPS